MSALHRNALLDDAPRCLRCAEHVSVGVDYCTRCDPEERCNGPVWLQLACALAIIIIFAVTNIALWRL